MAMPLYDCAVRTSKVASGEALVQLVPQASALGTGRMIRLRQVAISNTTATAFGVGIGIATAAAGTPATAQTIMRRGNPVGPVDAASTALVWAGFTTTPTAPTGYNARLWVPASSLVVWVFPEGEELMVPPASTPLPLCVFNTGTGQVADVTLTWAE
jgi:hypothetical protein